MGVPLLVTAPSTSMFTLRARAEECERRGETLKKKYSVRNESPSILDIRIAK